VIVAGVICTGALMAIQLLYFSRPSTNPRPARSHAMLVAQALLGYLPLLPFGQAWIGIPGFVAGSACPPGNPDNTLSST
jgi:two-component system sensor histidine kinase DesK